MGAGPFSEVKLGHGPSLLDAPSSPMISAGRILSILKTLASGTFSFGADNRNYDSIQRFVGAT